MTPKPPKSTMPPTTPPPWTPIAEVEWVDGALYWVRHGDGVDVVQVSVDTSYAKADVTGMPMGSVWDEWMITGGDRPRPRFVGAHVSGPLTPPAWGEGTDGDQP